MTSLHSNWNIISLIYIDGKGDIPGQQLFVDLSPEVVFVDICYIFFL